MFLAIFSTPMFKNPMVARIFCVFLTVVPSSLFAESWDEEKFVALAKELNSKERLAAELDLERAEVSERTAYELPSLSLEYEPLWGAELRRDEIVVGLSQSVDLSGWRGAMREASSLREQKAKAQATLLESEIEAAVRLAFWRVRFLEEKTQLIKGVEARLKDTLGMIQARANAGDAAGLDVVRVQRQIALVAAEQARATIELEEAWGDLTAWTGVQERQSAQGNLLPDTTLETAVEHPSEQILRMEEQALELEASGWGSPGFRNWEIGAGYRFEREAEAAHGVLVSLTIPLALWNIDDPLKASLEAKATLVQVEAVELKRRLMAARDSASRRLQVTRDALEAMPPSTEDVVLSDGVRKAYGADEADLFDVIEAMRSELELGLTRIELEWEARRAFVDLQFLNTTDVK